VGSTAGAVVIGLHSSARIYYFTFRHLQTPIVAVKCSIFVVPGSIHGLETTYPGDLSSFPQFFFFQKISGIVP
jgi:hypothetical protein